MARKKVRLAFIENDSQRKATFKKRRNGIMKKADEVSVLCGIDACLIMFSPYRNQPDVWPDHAGVARVIEKFRMLPEAEQKKRMHTYESFARERIAKASEQLKKQLKDNREMEMTMVMHDYFAGKELQGLRMVDLNDLQWVVGKNLNKVNKLIEALEISPVQEGGSGGAAPETGGLQPENVGVQPEHVGVQPEHVGVQPEHVGVQPENVGLQPENVGFQPVNVGLPPENVGLPPVNVGVQPENKGVQPESGGVQPENVGLQPEMFGLNLDAGEDQQRPQWFTDWIKGRNEEIGLCRGNDMVMPPNDANSQANVGFGRGNDMVMPPNDANNPGTGLGRGNNTGDATE